VAVDHGDGPVHDVGQACPLALEDGREVAERLASLDRLRRLFDHNGLAEGRAAGEPLGVDVPDAHVSPPLNGGQNGVDADGKVVGPTVGEPPVK
jgi:hypothetical protein